MSLALSTEIQRQSETRNRVTAEEIEALRRISDAGARRAQVSLSELLKRETILQSPRISVLPLALLMEQTSANPRELLGIHVRIIGEVSGEMYFLFTRTNAIRLVEMLVGERFRLLQSLNALETSALSEVANILTGSYWYAMTDRTALNWRITVPTIVEDVGRLLSLSSRVYDFNSMVFLTDLLVPDIGVSGHFLLIPRRESLSKLLTNLGELGQETGA